MIDVALFASQHPVIFTLVGFFLAGFFYWVRERLRIVFALLEIAAGVATMFKSTPTHQSGSFDQPFNQFYFGGFTEIQYLAILGAIYLIVRGFDNLDKGLQDCSVWKAFRTKLRMDQPIRVYKISRCRPDRP
jgi:hypothetical protein